MKNATHELVQDLFVFFCFSRIWRIPDVKNLTADRLQTFFDGNRMDNREEDQHRIEHPPFGCFKRIIEKYKGLAQGRSCFPRSE